MYTAHILDFSSSLKLCLRFPPQYSEFPEKHHITVDYGVPENTPIPPRSDIRVIGYIDSGDGLESLVVSIDGIHKRPDGNLYHITWSLDADKYSPKHSKDLLNSKRFTLIKPIDISADPSIL